MQSRILYEWTNRQSRILGKLVFERINAYTLVDSMNRSYCVFYFYIILNSNVRSPFHIFKQNSINWKPGCSLELKIDLIQFYLLYELINYNIVEASRGEESHKKKNLGFYLTKKVKYGINYCLIEFYLVLTFINRRDDFFICFFHVFFFFFCNEQKWNCKRKRLPRVTSKWNSIFFMSPSKNFLIYIFLNFFDMCFFFFSIVFFFLKSLIGKKYKIYINGR